MLAQLEHFLSLYTWTNVPKSTLQIVMDQTRVEIIIVLRDGQCKGMLEI
jgi:hypothetical protein